jgi:hypothetical protein
MCTLCRSWICGAFCNRRTVFLLSMIVAVREIHSCTVHGLKHINLQNSVNYISSHLAVFYCKICSIFADSLLHRNEKYILSSTVNCSNSGNAKGSSTPTHIPNVWLLSSIAVVDDKLTHSPNTVSVFCHGCSTDLPRHNCISCTFLLYFQHWPKQWHYWRQGRSLQFSRFLGSFWCIFSGAPWTRRMDCQMTNCFPGTLCALFLVSRSTLLFSWLDRPIGHRPPLWVFSITIGSTPLDEWSAARRDLYLTAHNILKERYLCCRRDSNLQSLQLAVTDPLLRPRDHLNRPFTFYVMGYWLYVATQCVHVTVSQYYALTVGIHISTPAAVYLACLAKLGAAASKTQRTCWMQSDSLTGHILRRLVHFVADWCADHDIAIWRRAEDNTIMMSLVQQHAVALWRTALWRSEWTDIRYSTFKKIDRLVI